MSPRSRAMVRRACVAVFAVMGAVLVVPDAVAAERVDFREIDVLDTDVEVFMLVDATDRQIDRVERAVQGTQSLHRYAHLDEHDAFEEFARIFERNPELVRSIRPGDLPESFRLELRDDGNAGRIVNRLDRMPGVESVVRPNVLPTVVDLAQTFRMCQRHEDAVFDVFMHVDAAPADLEAERAAITAEPGLVIIKELSKEDAYAELREIFPRNTKLLRQVQPADLPPSFRVRAPTTPSPDLVDRLGAAPGVESVETATAGCDEIRSLLDDGLTPEQLAQAFLDEVRRRAS